MVKGWQCALLFAGAVAGCDGERDAWERWTETDDFVERKSIGASRVFNFSELRDVTVSLVCDSNQSDGSKKFRLTMASSTRAANDQNAGIYAAWAKFDRAAPFRIYPNEHTDLSQEPIDQITLPVKGQLSQIFHSEVLRLRFDLQGRLGAADVSVPLRNSAVRPVIDECAVI